MRPASSPAAPVQFGTVRLLVPAYQGVIIFPRKVLVFPMHLKGIHVTSITMARAVIAVTALTCLPSAALFAARQPTAQTYTFNPVRVVGGGFVTGIVAHPLQSGLFYLRTDIGGTYRWDSGGQIWTPLTDGVSPDNWNLLGTASIAIDPTDPQKLYLAQGTYVETWAGNGAIFKSTNQGNSFVEVDLPFQLGANEPGRFSGERLAVVPWSTNVLYLGTPANGLWRSTDSAVTWSQVISFPITGPTNNDKVGIFCVTFGPALANASFPTIYVGVSDPNTGFYRSTDDGVTWQAIPGQPTGSVPTNAAFSSNGMLYATYSSSSGPNSGGNGQVWKYNTSTGIWSNITPANFDGTSPVFYGFAKVVVDPQNPNTVMVSTLDRYYPGDEIYRSTNGGATWAHLGAEPGQGSHSTHDVSLSPWLLFGGTSLGDNMGNWVGAMVIDPFNSNHFMYGTGGTVFTTGNLTSVDAGGVASFAVGAWGIEETAVTGLASPPSGAHLLSAIGDVGGFRHDNFGVSPPQGMFYTPQITSTTGIDFAQNNPMLIARVGWPAYGQALCGGYSADQGTTWTAFTNVTGCTNGPGTIAVSANGATLVWAPTGGAAAYSTDSGHTWTASAGLPSGLGVIVSDRVNSNKFYSFDQSQGTFYMSADGGKTFTAAATGLGTYSFAQISAVPGIEGDIWLSLKWNGLWHSTGSGVGFTKVSQPVWPDSVGFGMSAPGSAYPAIYLLGILNWGLPTQMFRSDNGGANWIRINDDRHQYGNPGIVLGDPRIYGRVYIGTNGRGILYGDVAH